MLEYPYFNKDLRTYYGISSVDNKNAIPHCISRLQTVNKHINTDRNNIIIP